MATRKLLPIPSRQSQVGSSLTLTGTLTAAVGVFSGAIGCTILTASETGAGAGGGQLRANVTTANGNPLVSWYSNSVQRWGMQGLGTAVDSLRVYDYTAGQELMRFKTGQLIGMFGATPVAKQTVSGSRGANAALASLLTALAAFGWITDSTSA